MTVTSCSQNTYVSRECLWAVPIYPVTSDSQGTKDQVLKHNLKYEEDCNARRQGYKRR